MTKEEEILGSGKMISTNIGEVEIYLKEHCLNAMKTIHNTAIDDAIEVVRKKLESSNQGSLSATYFSPLIEDAISNLQSLKK